MKYKCIAQNTTKFSVLFAEIIGIPTTLSDPRLGRDRPLFATSEQLVGTVEKTLSFLGFEDKKPEAITPTKRKLSITEYLQRKKVTSSDKSDDQNCMEENNCTMSQSPKPMRNRSNSSSSNTSLASSDDDTPLIDLPRKGMFTKNCLKIKFDHKNWSSDLITVQVHSLEMR